MPDLAMFTIERNDDQVEVRLVTIPDDLGDEEENSAAGISFSRLHALHFALKIIRATLGR